MTSERSCNNKECTHCKKGVCRNRKFKCFNDYIGCEERVICICRLEDSPVIKTEVYVETGSMTLEHCADCGIGIKSYPTKPLGNPYERLTTLVETMLKKNIEDRIIAENNNDHATALKLNGGGSVLAEISFYIEHMKLSSK
jgi:hypothetical protein